MSSLTASLQHRQPNGLYVITLGELWDRFSYYGTSTLLVLYLTKVFIFDDHNAYAFFGAYSALGFATPVLGGYLADRLLGFERAIVLGALSIILGNLILLLPYTYSLNIGLALTLCGTGLFKGNITSLISRLYSPHDPRRERGVTIFYMGMNTGAILGPIFYGFLTLHFGWHTGFLCSAIGMSIGLVFFILYKKKIINGTEVLPQSEILDNTLSNQKQLVLNRWLNLPEKKQLTKKLWFKFNLNHLFFAVLIFTLIAISLLFYYPKLLNQLLAVFMALTFIALIAIAFRSPKYERYAILSIIVMSLFDVFFFASSIQTSSSLMLFIERHVNHSFYGWTIPPTVFAAIEPLAIIMITPLFLATWKFLQRHQLEPAPPIKLVTGLLFAAAGIGNFALAAIFYQSQMFALLFIVIGNVLIGAGEICIAPTLISTITRLAPPKLLGTLMGMWFMSLSLAGFVGSLFAQMTVVSGLQKQEVHAYNAGFSRIALVMLLAGIIGIIITPLIKKLINQSTQPTTLPINNN